MPPFHIVALCEHYLPLAFLIAAAIEARTNCEGVVRLPFAIDSIAAFIGPGTLNATCTIFSLLTLSPPLCWP